MKPDSTAQPVEEEYKTQYLTFNKSFTSKVRNLLWTPEISFLMNKDSLSFCKSSHQSNLVLQVFAHMKSNFYTFVMFSKNQHPKIINFITAPHFRCLTILILAHNDIQNIENLAFLKADLLKFVDLNSNLITSIKPLNKTKWSKFQFLLLYKNRIMNGQINRMKTLDNYNYIKFEENQSEKCNIEDLNVYAKLEPIKVNSIFIDQKSRIQQQKVRLSVLRKITNSKND